jgi:hypothetical protein
MVPDHGHHSGLQTTSPANQTDRLVQALMESGHSSLLFLDKEYILISR